MAHVLRLSPSMLLFCRAWCKRLPCVDAIAMHQALRDGQLRGEDPRNRQCEIPSQFAVAQKAGTKMEPWQVQTWTKTCVTPPVQF